MAEIITDKVNKFIGEQIAEWPQAAGNYAALSDVKVKQFQ